MAHGPRHYCLGGQAQKSPRVGGFSGVGVGFSTTSNKLIVTGKRAYQKQADSYW